MMGNKLKFEGKRIRYILSWVWVMSFFACSNHKEGKEVDRMDFYKTTRFVSFPGEVLEYEASAGLFTVGYISLSVLEKTEVVEGKTCAHLVARSGNKPGVDWIAQIKHDWDSWIDTSNGLSVRMHRFVQENKYHAEQEIMFYPDSNKLVQANLHKPGKPRKDYPSNPEKMNDLVNMIWKLRYTPFENYAVGDSIRYPAFLDGEWVVTGIVYAGKKALKIDGKKRECFILLPFGISSPYLRGKNPAEIWIEVEKQRRPLKVKVSSYVGNLTIDLKNP